MLNENDIQELADVLVEVIWEFGPQNEDKLCCTDLSIAEYRALKSIYTSSLCSIQDIGRHMGFTKSGATRIVNRLEKKGFASRHRSETDGRICCVKLTAKGRAAISGSAKSYRDAVQRVVKNMPPEQADNLHESLKTFIKTLRVFS